MEYIFYYVEYIHRTYRENINKSDLITYEVVVKETNLLVSAKKDLRKETEFLVKKYRKQVENYILFHPKFKMTLLPYSVSGASPKIIKEMADAARKANVGPMASVAGAIAEFVGYDLLRYTDELIIENGGDIFLKTKKKRFIGIFAGESILSDKLAIEISPDETPVGVCTSSGTVGPSLSFGCADAVVVVSRSAILADAVATAVGNKIISPESIKSGIEFAKKIKGVKGVVIIIRDKIGIWGDISLSTL